MQECQKIIKENIKKNSTIVVSCSGGPDSMCLLKNVIDLQDELNLNIVVAHINHNVRKESDEEQEMIKKYVSKHNLIFECYKIEEYNNENFHNEARIIRYDFMREIIKKYKAKYLLTAHHADDLMETILMRIARGSNLKGYSGFKMISDEGTYKAIHPLINNTKSEIIEYDDANHIPYAIDSTNLTDDYTRNRYRNHVLPFLKAENKNIHLKYIDYSNKIIEADDFIDEIVSEVYKDIFKNKVLFLDKFLDNKKIIQTRILEKFLYDTYKYDLYNIGDKHIDEIIKLIKKNGNGRVNLPLNYYVEKEYNNLSIKKDNKVDNYNEELNGEVEIDEIGRVFITNEVGNSNYFLKINSKEVRLPIVVRNRCEGDFISVKNLNGKQKVKKIFIDNKISRDKRDRWPIVCDSNNNILWIPGLKKSQFDKSNDELYDIIIKYEEEKHE